MRRARVSPFVMRETFKARVWVKLFFQAFYFISVFGNLNKTQLFGCSFHGFSHISYALFFLLFFLFVVIAVLLIH